METGACNGSLRTDGSRPGFMTKGVCACLRDYSGKAPTILFGNVCTDIRYIM
jgi:hypothetical protein